VPRPPGKTLSKQAPRHRNEASGDIDSVFIAHASPWRILLIIAAGCGLLAASLFTAGVIGETPKPGWESVGWLGAVVFGLMIPFWIVRLFNRRAYLRIDEQGILYKGLSAASVPWDDIARAEMVMSGNQKYIGLLLKQPEAYLTGLKAKMSELNHRMFGVDVAITLVGTNGDFDHAMAAIQHFSGRA
jgi:hypothetical protein